MCGDPSPAIIHSYEEETVKGGQVSQTEECAVVELLAVLSYLTYIPFVAGS